MADNRDQILKKAGLKVTPARLAILKIFLAEEKPLKAEDVFSRLKNKKVDQATVYRNLDSFEKKGIIKKVDLRKDSTYFELPTRHHHHIVCTGCGTVEDFSVPAGKSGCWADEVSKKALRNSKKFKRIQDHSLELFGACKECS